MRILSLNTSLRELNRCVLDQVLCSFDLNIVFCTERFSRLCLYELCLVNVRSVK